MEHHSSSSAAVEIVNNNARKAQTLFTCLYKVKYKATSDDIDNDDRSVKKEEPKKNNAGGDEIIRLSQRIDFKLHT